MQPNNQLNEFFKKYDEIPRKERKCNYIKCSIKTKKKKRQRKGGRQKLELKEKERYVPRTERRCGQVGLLAACSSPGPWTV